MVSNVLRQVHLLNSVLYRCFCFNFLPFHNLKLLKLHLGNNSKGAFTKFVEKTNQVGRTQVVLEMSRVFFSRNSFTNVNSDGQVAKNCQRSFCPLCPLMQILTVLFFALHVMNHPILIINTCKVDVRIKKVIFKEDDVICKANRASGIFCK